MDMQNCTLCPRLCHVDRTKNYGVCLASDKVEIALVSLHQWEEPCLSGTNGAGTVFFSHCNMRCIFCQNHEISTEGKVEIALVSLHQWEEPCLSGTNGAGTVFFSHCNMRCIFCQNHEISTEGKGFPVTIERLAQIFLEQQARNAHCLELVTPTHYVLQIIEALKLAKKQGLSIPVVYNTSGYERVEVLEMLKDYIDVFLPDFKYYSPDTAKEFSHAPDYPQVVKEAIDKMFELVGKPQFKNNIMQKGVIIRHLILPWYYKESMEIVKYIWEKYHDDVYLSLMNQYTPMYKALTHPKLKRKLTTFEYDKVVDYALDLGFKNCYIQQGKTATTKFVPHFDGTNVY